LFPEEKFNVGEFTESTHWKSLNSRSVNNISTTLETGREVEIKVEDPVVLSGHLLVT
jgi:hypothetical protein